LTEQPLPGSADAQVRALLQERRKIEAIKVCRESTGLGLKEAKERVEAIEREMGLPGRSTPGSAGCLGVAILVVIVAYLAWSGLHG
jgi:hypothetical protein